jgi:hypothetical protein
MRTYEVTVTLRPKGKRDYRHWESWHVETYTFDSPFNIRAATIGIFYHFFGKHPRFHWAASGSLGMGQACDTKSLTKCGLKVEVHQVTRMTEAYEAAREVICRALQPRLTERRAE